MLGTEEGLGEGETCDALAAAVIFAFAALFFLCRDEMVAGISSPFPSALDFTCD